MNFKELEKSVIDEFTELNKRAGKPVYPNDLIEISTKVAIAAIRKYHQTYSQSPPETQ